MKKVKQILVLLMLCIVSCLLFACAGLETIKTDDREQEKNQQEQKVITYNLSFSGSYEQEKLPFGDKYINSSIESDLKIKADSLSQLISGSEENDFPFFDETDENYNSALSKKIREYDDDFFADKSLILIFSFGTNYSTIRITGATLKSTTLTVTASKPDEVYSSDIKKSFVYILEMDKKDVKDVLQIEMQLKSAGVFYTLKDGFEREFLTDSDVKSIIYYFKNGRGYEADFVPQPKSPQEIDAETNMKIRDTLLAYFYSCGYPLDPEGPDYQHFLNTPYLYLGTYNGYTVIYYEISIGMVANQTRTVADETYTTAMWDILLWKGE